MLAAAARVSVRPCPYKAMKFPQFGILSADLILIVSSDRLKVLNATCFTFPSLPCCCYKYHWSWWLYPLHCGIDRRLCQDLDVIGSERWNSPAELVLLNVHVILIIYAIEGDEQEFNNVRINLWVGMELTETTSIELKRFRTAQELKTGDEDGEISDQTHRQPISTFLAWLAITTNSGTDARGFTATGRCHSTGLGLIVLAHSVRVNLCHDREVLINRIFSLIGIDCRLDFVWDIGGRKINCDTIISSMSLLFFQQLIECLGASVGGVLGVWLECYRCRGKVIRLKRFNSLGFFSSFGVGIRCIRGMTLKQIVIGNSLSQSARKYSRRMRNMSAGDFRNFDWIYVISNMSSAGILIEFPPHHRLQSFHSQRKFVMWSDEWLDVWMDGNVPDAIIIDLRRCGKRHREKKRPFDAKEIIELAPMVLAGWLANGIVCSAVAMLHGCCCWDWNGATTAGGGEGAFETVFHQFLFHHFFWDGRAARERRRAFARQRLPQKSIWVHEDMKFGLEKRL